MRTNIHEHYDQLTDDERTFVNDAMKEIFALAKFNPHSRDVNTFSPELNGADPAERAADAIARWVIESRKTPVVASRCC
jgi:hypothetical protein